MCPRCFRRPDVRPRPDRGRRRTRLLRTHAARSRWPSTWRIIPAWRISRRTSRAGRLAPSWGRRLLAPHAHPFGDDAPAVPGHRERQHGAEPRDTPNRACDERHARPGRGGRARLHVGARADYLGMGERAIFPSFPPLRDVSCFFDGVSGARRVGRCSSPDGMRVQACVGRGRTSELMWHCKPPATPVPARMGMSGEEHPAGTELGPRRAIHAAGWPSQITCVIVCVHRGSWLRQRQYLGPRQARIGARLAPRRGCCRDSRHPLSAHHFLSSQGTRAGDRGQGHEALPLIRSHDHPLSRYLFARPYLVCLDVSMSRGPRVGGSVLCKHRRRLANIFIAPPSSGVSRSIRTSLMACPRSSPAPSLLFVASLTDAGPRAICPLCTLTH
ncbi:hypothetical protein DFH09DRAFT_1374996, partial [Mycena vulgaris]